MHDRAAEFTERANRRYDVELKIQEFEAGTETAAAAAEAVGCEPAAIASTIVVSLSTGEPPTGNVPTRDPATGETLVAAITSGANRLDLNAVADHFDVAAAAMGSPDRIRSVVGWSIGGVPPICHDTSIPTVMDPTLCAFEQVYGAAGTPSALFSIAPERLADLAEATVVDLTE